MGVFVMKGEGPKTNQEDQAVEHTGHFKPYQLMVETILNMRLIFEQSLDADSEYYQFLSANPELEMKHQIVSSFIMAALDQEETGRMKNAYISAMANLSKTNGWSLMMFFPFFNEVGSKDVYDTLADNIEDLQELNDAFQEHHRLNVLKKANEAIKTCHECYLSNTSKRRLAVEKAKKLIADIKEKHLSTPDHSQETKKSKYPTKACPKPPSETNKARRCAQPMTTQYGQRRRALVHRPQPIKSKNTNIIPKRQIK